MVVMRLRLPGEAGGGCDGRPLLHDHLLPLRLHAPHPHPCCQAAKGLGKDWGIDRGKFYHLCPLQFEEHFQEQIKVSILSLLLLTVLGVGTSFAMACAFVRYPIVRFPDPLVSWGA